MESKSGPAMYVQGRLQAIVWEDIQTAACQHTIITILSYTSLEVGHVTLLTGLPHHLALSGFCGDKAGPGV